MKKTMIKTVLAGILALGMVSCADDLNISSIDPQTVPPMTPCSSWPSNTLACR